MRHRIPPRRHRVSRHRLGLAVEALESRQVPAVFKIFSVPTLTLDKTVVAGTDGNQAWGSVPKQDDVIGPSGVTLVAGVSRHTRDNWPRFPSDYSGGFTLSGDLVIEIQPEHNEQGDIDVTLDLGGSVLYVPNSGPADVHLKVGVIGQGTFVDKTNPPSGGIGTGYAPEPFAASVPIHAKIGEKIVVTVDAAGHTDNAWHDARENGPGMVEALLSVGISGIVTQPDIAVEPPVWDGVIGVTIPYAINVADLPEKATIELFWDTDLSKPIYSFQTPTAQGPGYFEHVTWGQLGAPPPGATHLVAWADRADKIDEVDDQGNNQMGSPIEILAPRVALQVPGAGMMNDQYSVQVVVTNPNPFPVDVELAWQEFGTLPLPKDQEHDVTTTIPQVAANDSETVPLGTFKHNWPWIPPDILSAIVDGLKGLRVGLRDQIATGAFDNLLKVFFAKTQAVLSDSLLGINFVISAVEAAQQTEPTVDVTYIARATSEFGSLRSGTEQDRKQLTLDTPSLKKANYYAGYVGGMTLASNSLNAALMVLAFPSPDPITKAIGVVGALDSALAFFGLALAEYAMAKDPPDSNYREIAVPSPVVLPALESEPDGFSKGLALMASELAGLVRAEATSIDRSQGADLAGDADWESQQLIAASDFATRAAQLQARLLGGSQLMVPLVSRLIADHAAEAADRAQADGLPAAFVQELAALGFDATQIDAIRDTAIGWLRDGISSDPVLWLSAIRYGEINSAGSAYDHLQQAVRVRVEGLGLAVRDLTPQERQHLDDLKTAADAEQAAATPSTARVQAIDAYLTEARRLAIETNNIDVLRADLDLGYTALTNSMRHDPTPTGLRAFVDQLAADGQVGAGTADALRSVLAAVDGQVAAAQFEAIPQAMQDFSAAVQAARGAGLSADVADQLTAFARTTAALVDRPPTAGDDAATGLALQAILVDVLANDSSPGGAIDPTTVTIVSAPSHGTAIVDTSSGYITYTSAAGFSGTDSFTYTVKDSGGASSNPATVTITVVPNQPPVALDDSETARTGVPTTLSIFANDEDPDGVVEPTTATIVAPPSHGTVTVEPGTGVVRYTSAAGFAGTDSFTYTVKDDSGSPSNVATVTVTVAPNRPPTAADDQLGADANVANLVDVLANDVDPDGSITPVDVTIVAGPAHGTVSFDPSLEGLVYTPAAGFTGADSFTYTVKDDEGAASNVALVSLTVGPRLTVTSPTVGGPLPPGGTPVGGIVLDLIGKNGIRVVSQLAASALFRGYYNSGTPEPFQGNPGTIGIQTGFTQAIRDSLGGGLAEVAVRITLQDGDTGPGDFDDGAQNFLMLNGLRMGDFSDVVTRETNGDGMTVLSRNPGGGFRDNLLDTGFFYSKDPTFLAALFETLSTGQVIYQVDDVDPYDNFFDFTQGVDGGLINVGQAPNVSPIVGADAAATSIGTPVNVDVLANDHDPDGTPIPSSVTIVAAPAHGRATVDPATGRITYVPDAGFSGADALSYTVADDRGAVSAPAALVLTIGLPSNVGPTGTPDVATTSTGTPITIDVLANDRDPDGSLVPSSVTVVAAPAHGRAAVDPATGRITYVPDAGFSGADALSYTVADDRGAVSSPMAVTLTVIRPSPADTTGPVVLGVRRSGFHWAPTVLTVAFSEPVSRARAEDPRNYVAQQLGRFGTVAIASARLDATGRVVTLYPTRRLSFYGWNRLLVRCGPGGITDLAGNLLDGNADGLQGDHFVGRFTGFGMSPRAAVRIGHPLRLRTIARPFAVRVRH